MIKFKWYVTENNKKIIIEKDNQFTEYDNPKNASEVCYLLLTGTDLLLENNINKNYDIAWTQCGNELNLKNIVDSYRYSDYLQTVFTSVFFEEINLLFFINSNFK